MPIEGQMITIVVNGRQLSAQSDSTIAATLLSSGVRHFRRSVGGSPRAPLCGMGLCYECRVKVNGEANVRACMELVQDGMRVETDE